MKKPSPNRPSPQLRVQRETQRRKTHADGLTLFINGLKYEERNYLRARVFYSGAGDDYIASNGSMLALAVAELLALRGRRKARVRLNAIGQLVLTCKRKRRNPKGRIDG